MRHVAAKISSEDVRNIIAENILLVNHGGTAQRLIELLLEDATGFSETNNSSTTIIKIDTEGNKMVDFNNISYFQEDDIS